MAQGPSPARDPSCKDSHIRLRLKDTWRTGRAGVKADTEWTWHQISQHLVLDAREDKGLACTNICASITLTFASDNPTAYYIYSSQPWRDCFEKRKLALYF